MPEICENCGAEVKNGANFCPECGSEIVNNIKNYCPECGGELGPGEEFCSKCGNNLNRNSSSTSSNHKIIILLLAVIVIILAGALLSGVFTSHDVPLGNKDFGGITMLVPVGSDFVETYSSPAIGTVGGFIMYENAGKYSHDAFSITFSTLMTNSAPSDFILDRHIGDITIYKDRNGGDGKYMIRDVGDVEVDMIGSNEDVMIKMLNSVDITTTYNID